MTGPAKPRANPALRLALIRRIHSWLGLFIAPSVVFFALTGAVQLYGLHEAHGAYQPPAIIEKLGMVHKDQVFKAKPKRAAAKPVAAGAAAPAKPKAEAGPKVTVAILKALFLVVALALVASTLLGVWMAQAYGRDKRAGWILLAAGTVLPILLVVL